MMIYKKYDQQQLNLQYDNRFHVPGFQYYLDRWQQLSSIAENTNVVVKNIQYGGGSREHLDIFPSAAKASKTLTFIHGGYWQRFDKSSFYFVADAFARYNITTVLINYPLAPVVSMDQVVQSCDKAIEWIGNNIQHWNGDAGELYLVGHSAGAHLAAMLLTKEKEPAKSNLKAVCGLSGLYNLLPVHLSNLNQVLQMDAEMASSISPVFKEPVVPCPFLIAVGESETDEFLDQSREMTNAWKNKNPATELMVVPGLNHFSILDSFCDVNSMLHQSMRRLMND